MANVGDIAKNIERKILETPQNNFVVVSNLSKNDAERLTNDYLAKYDARLEAINPDHPFSSYLVAVAGGQKNA